MWTYCSWIHRCSHDNRSDHHSDSAATCIHRNHIGTDTSSMLRTPTNKQPATSTSSSTVQRTSSYFWDRSFAVLCCGHKSVGQFAGRLTKQSCHILPVQAVAEDVFILTVPPRRIVNCSFLTAPCRNIRTYWLTCLYSDCGPQLQTAV